MAKLFVGNLNETITGDDLRDEFQRFGTVSHVWVAKNPPGFAFIEFPDQRDAIDAKNGMQGRMIGSCSLRVDYKRGTEPALDRDAGAEAGSVASYGGSGGRCYGGVQGDRFGRDVSPPRGGQGSSSYGDRAPPSFSRDAQRVNGFNHDTGGARGGPAIEPIRGLPRNDSRSSYDRGNDNGYGGGRGNGGGYSGGRGNGSSYGGGRGGFGNGNGRGNGYGGGGYGGRSPYGGRGDGRNGDTGGGRGGGGRSYGGGNTYAGSSAQPDAGRQWEDRSYGAPPSYQPQQDHRSPPGYSSYYR